MQAKLDQPFFFRLASWASKKGRGGKMRGFFSLQKKWADIFFSLSFFQLLISSSSSSSFHWCPQTLHCQAVVDNKQSKSFCCTEITKRWVVFLSSEVSLFHFYELTKFVTGWFDPRRRRLNRDAVVGKGKKKKNPFEITATWKVVAGLHCTAVEQGEFWKRIWKKTHRISSSSLSYQVFKRSGDCLCREKTIPLVW